MIKKNNNTKLRNTLVPTDILEYQSFGPAWSVGTKWHCYLENILISSAAGNWSRLVAKVWGATCIAAAGAAAGLEQRAKIGGEAIALFQNRSRTVYHRCPHPSSSMHRLLLAEEMGRSHKGKVRVQALRSLLYDDRTRPKPVNSKQKPETAKQSQNQINVTQAMASWRVRAKGRREPHTSMLI